MSSSQTSEHRAVGVALSVSAVMMAQIIAGKAVRDSLFLHAFGVQSLPQIMVGGALLSFLLAELAGWLFGHLGPTRVVPFAFGVSALGFVLDGVFYPVFPKLISVLLYLHVTGGSAVLASGFWSVISERFDPLSAKRYVGRITAGGSIGGVIGGIGAWLLSFRQDVSSMLYVFCAFNVLAAFGVLTLGFGSSSVLLVPAGNGAVPNSSSPVKQVLRHPYLRGLALVVVLGAVVQAILDYWVSASAVHSLGRGTRLTTFFFGFYIITNLLGFVGQLGIGERVLRRHGLVGAVATLPFTVVGGLAMAAVLRGLSGAIFVRGTELVIRNAVYRPGYEALFTPLPAEQRRKTKSLIDVAADRLGTALGSGLITALLWLLKGNLPRPLLIGVTVLIALMGLWFSLRLREGYVSTLETSLRSGMVMLEPSEVLDKVTLQTLTFTAVNLDRQSVLDELAKRGNGTVSGVQSAHSVTSGVHVPVARLQENSEVLQMIAALASHDPGRCSRYLGQGAVDVRAVPWLIELLLNDALLREVSTTLTAMLPGVTGQLLDVLNDPSRPGKLRRRLPRLLARAPSERAIRGLLFALDAKGFEVRFACARALFHMTAHASHYPIEPSMPVWRAIRAELSQPPPTPGATERRIQYLFALFGLVVDREPFGLAIKAARSGDRRLEGTALEYMVNVLPRDLLPTWIRLLSLDIEQVPQPRPVEPTVKELLLARKQLESGPRHPLPRNPRTGKLS